jgi:hypothetical protein
VQLFEHTARVAAQLEYSPAEVQTAIETQQAQPTLLDPGAIRWWIMHDRTWPAKGVQDPSVLREAHAKRDAERLLAEAAAVKEAADAESRRCELRALEAAYGSELDGLVGDQLTELARLTFRTDFEFCRFRRDPRSEYVRYRLLVAIHANRDPAGLPPAGGRRVGVVPVEQPAVAR